MKHSEKKPWYMRWWFHVIVGLIWLVVIPKFVDLLYFLGLTKHEPNTTLGADTVLNYVSSALGAAITILGIRLAAHFSQKQLKEQVRHEALPYISINFSPESVQILAPNIDIAEAKEGDVIVGTPCNNTPDFERSARLYNFIINDSIVYSDSLSDARQQMMGTFIVQNNEVHRQAQYILIKLHSAGKESAIDFFPCLVRKGKAGKIAAIPQLFPVNEIRFIGLLIEDRAKAIGFYELLLNYKDFYNNSYQQKHSITICADGIEISGNSPQTLL